MEGFALLWLAARPSSMFARDLGANTSFQLFPSHKGVSPGLIPRHPDDVARTTWQAIGGEKASVVVRDN